LTEHWKIKFDWKKTEEELNNLPNYTTTVDVGEFRDVDVHFLHQPSTDKNAVPLIFVHGWVRIIGFPQSCCQPVSLTSPQAWKLHRGEKVTPSTGRRRWQQC